MFAAVARDVHQNLCLLPMLGEADRSLLDFPAHTLGILSLHGGPLFPSILQWPQNPRSWFYWITTSISTWTPFCIFGGESWFGTNLGIHRSPVMTRWMVER